MTPKRVARRTAVAPMPPIPNVDVIRGVAGRVILFGEERDVYGLSAEQFLLNGQFHDLDHAVDIITSIVPSCTRAQIATLQPTQLAAIYSVGAGAAERVSQLFPNGKSPGTAAAAPG